ncbi:uncharacterized protein [Phyllobates terribilis]|uniref:uncharacterized protein isoform X1 n=1 Tax=Phyllobates terribilis TaxID=111132 RepID=UPI003CCA7B79
MSSHVTFGRCEPNVVFKITREGVTAHIPCDTTPVIPHKLQDKLRLNKTSRFITLHNVTKSDAGYYTLERTNGNGEKYKQTIEVRVLDLVWIHELLHNETDRTISFTLDNAADLRTIHWKIDGEELLAGPWRSPDNRTLTIVYNHTGTITVNVSNVVSADSKSITVVRDRNGNFSPLCHIMYPNMTRLIWDEAGNHTGNWTLILPRNTTDICVLIPSDKMGEPQSRSRNHFVLIGVPMVILCVIILVVVWCKKSNKCRKQIAQDGHVEENHKNERVSMLMSISNGSPEENGSAGTGHQERVIPSKDPEKLSIDETAGDDPTANDIDRSGQTTQI